MAPGFGSPPNRNEYQKMFARSKALPGRKADNLAPPVNRLSIQFGILKSHSHIGLHGLLWG
jgi:hypothetical protein